MLPACLILEKADVFGCALGHCGDLDEFLEHGSPVVVLGFDEIPELIDFFGDDAVEVVSRRVGLRVFAACFFEFGFDELVESHVNPLQLKTGCILSFGAVVVKPR